MKQRVESDALSKGPAEPGVTECLHSSPTLKFPPQIILFRQGEAAERVYSLTAGIVKLKYLHPNGREVIVGLRHSGSLLGAGAMLLNRSHATTAETVTCSELVQIPESQFKDMLRTNTQFMTLLNKLLAGEVENHVVRLVEHTSHSTRLRLLRLLHGIASEIAAGPIRNVRIPLKQWEIAELLAVTPEHTNRVLRRLEREGLVRRQQKFLIVDDTQCLSQIDLAQETS